MRKCIIIDMKVIKNILWASQVIWWLKKNNPPANT